MISFSHLSEYIIFPTLELLNMNSLNALELLLFTCAVESDGGKFLKQKNGVALGIYQMEPATHSDIWVNYIQRKEKIKEILAEKFNILEKPDNDRLLYDLRYATIMTRLHYYRITQPLPEHNNPNEIWLYYKQYYNTYFGKSEKETSLKKYYFLRKK